MSSNLERILAFARNYIHWYRAFDDVGMFMKKSVTIAIVLKTHMDDLKGRSLPFRYSFKDKSTYSP